MSPGFSVASDALTFCSASSATISAATLKLPLACSGGSNGEPTLMAITTAALQRSRASRIGTLSARPPSTIRWPSTVNGASSPGTAVLTPMACARQLSRSITRWPLPMAVAMIDSVNERRSISHSPTSACTSWLKTSLIFCPPPHPAARSRPGR